MILRISKGRIDFEGYIDVGDRYRRRNVLVTSLKSFHHLYVGDRFVSLKSHQHNDLANLHQHHVVTSITVTIFKAEQSRMR